MLWKYCLPESWNSHEERIALEDVFLMKMESGGEGESFWVTLEGLQSKTGGTREEKLRRLGEREYVIDDGLDMLVGREDFNRDELLFWVKEFIRVKLGDAEPDLREADPSEFEATRPLARAVSSPVPRARPVRILFVFHQERLQATTPDSLLGFPSHIEIRTGGAVEGMQTSLAAADLEWADLVIVLGRRVRSFVHRRCKALGLDRRLICLYLPENIDVADPAYAAAFRDRVGFYLQRLGVQCP
jgi:predicted protein tyrosine phosphatase